MPQRESLEKPGRRHGKFPEIRLGDEFRFFGWWNFMCLAQPHYKEILSGYESAYHLTMFPFHSCGLHVEREVERTSDIM